MHEVFKSLLPRYFLNIYGPGGPYAPKQAPPGPIEGVGPQTPNFFRKSRGSQ